MKTPEHTSRAGFTLVEVMISVSIAAILATSATMAAAESYVAYTATTTNSTLETNIRRSLDRVIRELMSTSFDVITPANLDDDFGSNEIVFQEAVAVVDNAIVWGNARRLAFEYEDGELDDGVDNNGNGLVDEGQLVLTRNDGLASEQRIVICHNVSELLDGEEDDGDDDNGNGIIDEAGFNIHQEGDVLTIRLTLEQPSEQVGVVQRTLATSIRLRN
jgi:prepilin-type N-terminal cleavage/methylation domain-containing protein